MWSINEDEMARMVSRGITEDGIRPTVLPFLSLIRSSQATSLNQGMLRPSVCFVIQGSKRMLVGNDVVYYGVDSYVAASVDMPTSGQIVDASRAKPYLGIKIDLEPAEIASLVMEAKVPIVARAGVTRGAYVGKSTPELRMALARLVGLLDRPQEISFLAPAIKQEILYRLLTAPDGDQLYQNIVSDYQGVGIGKAIDWLKKNYASPMSIEKLAREVNMSVSGLHHQFKAVTTLSPLQYQKRLRLLEARRLLMTGDFDAATAGFMVGYESPSQFSREYSRLFGAPPRRDIQQLRKTPLTPPVQDQAIFLHDPSTTPA